MPSTFTSNLGIEKPGSGEQSGTWGNTVNTNMDILDRAINGTATLSLSGLTSTLTTTDGTLSDGQNKLLWLTGSLVAGHTITVAPTDAHKLYWVYNAAGYAVTVTQGTGGNAVVPAGELCLVHADGAGAGAKCTNISASALFTDIEITGGTISGTDLNTAVAALAASFVDATDGTTAIAPNLTEGSWEVGGTAVTSTAAELNLLDGVTATTAELNILDGVTATTAELNYTDGVTANIQTQIDGKQPLDATLTGLAGLTTGANKVPYSTGADTFSQLDFKDEDNMASNSATAIPSQQSVKAYVDANSVKITSGSAPYYGARAWVNFNGLTGAIRSGQNVASVVRNSTGLYTVTFSVAMPHANYAVTGTAVDTQSYPQGQSSTVLVPDTRTTTTLVVGACYISSGLQLRDAEHVDLVIFA